MLRKEIQRPRAEENFSMTGQMKMLALALKLLYHHLKTNLLRFNPLGKAVEARLAARLIFKTCTPQALL